MVNYTVNKTFIIFSDLKGFSGMGKNSKENYLKKYMEISSNLKSKLANATTFNTWGDAFIASFNKGKDACDFMFSLRTFIFESEKDGKILKIVPRIAAHYGEVALFDDPILEKPNILGVEVNTTARIEPVTRPGEIFVTKEFREAFENQLIGESDVEFDELGFVKLAKNFGDHELYRLRRKSENPQIIDRLYKRTIEQALPNPAAKTAEEKVILEEITALTSREKIVKNLETILVEKTIEEYTGEFCIEIAKFCKKAGLYTQGEEWVNAAQRFSIMNGDICLYPYKTKKNVVMLKADILTRLNKFEEAAGLLYDLWQNLQDENSKESSEILAMLAAQFKRRAIDEKSNEIIDNKLLMQALNLYLEAFRRDIENHYPAINAAYLQVMLKGEEAESGQELARYIEAVWGPQKGSDHWLDFTLAQCKLLNDDYLGCAKDLEMVLHRHKDVLGVFDIESTRIQIEQYLTIMGLKAKGQPILSALTESPRMTV